MIGFYYPIPLDLSGNASHILRCLDTSPRPHFNAGGSCSGILFASLSLLGDSLK